MNSLRDVEYPESSDCFLHFILACTLSYSCSLIMFPQMVFACLHSRQNITEEIAHELQEQVFNKAKSFMTFSIIKHIVSYKDCPRRIWHCNCFGTMRNNGQYLDFCLRFDRNLLWVLEYLESSDCFLCFILACVLSYSNRLILFSWLAFACFHWRQTITEEIVHEVQEEVFNKARYNTLFFY